LRSEPRRHRAVGAGDDADGRRSRARRASTCFRCMKLLIRHACAARTMRLSPSGNQTSLAARVPGNGHTVCGPADGSQRGRYRAPPSSLRADRRGRTPNSTACTTTSRETRAAAGVLGSADSSGQVATARSGLRACNCRAACPEGARTQGTGRSGGSRKHRRCRRLRTPASGR
jgi:hypothetical protein